MSKSCAELESKIDVNGKERWNETSLITASENGHLEIVKDLVENGADVNSKDEDGKIALNKASSSGHLEIVKYLVS